MQAWPYLEPPKEVLLAAEKEAGDDPLYPRRDSGHWSTPPLPSASPDIIATDLGLSPEQNAGKNKEPSTLDLAHRCKKNYKHLCFASVVAFWCFLSILVH